MSWNLEDFPTNTDQGKPLEVFEMEMVKSLYENITLGLMFTESRRSASRIPLSGTVVSFSLLRR
jgi:hypothetical protein